MRPQKHQTVSLSSRAPWSNLHPWLRDNQQLMDFLKQSCTLIIHLHLYPKIYKGCIFGPTVLTPIIFYAYDLRSLISQPANKHCLLFVLIWLAGELTPFISCVIRSYKCCFPEGGPPFNSTLLQLNNPH